MTLCLHPNGKKRNVSVPITTNYKYLGVKISRNLNSKPQILALKQKINFITNAFTSIRIASQNIKFCFNTWEIFVRPLLDYSQTLFFYLSDKDRDQLHTLYRQSVRKMLFLQKSTPTSLIDKLIQYDYKTLHEKYRKVANDKAEARIEQAYGDARLKVKINFKYNKLDLAGIPPIWGKIWNLLSLKNVKCKAPNHLHNENFRTNLNHMIETLAENNVYNIINKLYAILNNPDDECITQELYKTYDLLLSFL